MSDTEKLEETKTQKTKAEKKEDPMEQLVDYTAPLMPGMKKKDIIVGVNGELLRIKRGVPVKIKRKFYLALQNASQQEFAAYEAMQQIKSLGTKPMANL